MSLLLNDDNEMEFSTKHQVKTVVKNCIHELLERFWVLRDQDETLFYQIKDHEGELKKYFRETFRYRLLSTHDMVKLEKLPMKSQPWMGEKWINSSLVFRTPQDYAFFFWVLAFLESKSIEQQFTLQNICEFLEDKEENSTLWKSGVGYKNRLSLVRILKYAVKMRLIQVDDQELDDFTGDQTHDVLLQRTPHSSYFMRRFQTDVTDWTSLEDVLDFIQFENHDSTERKHRFYRRLFLEPVVYHDDLEEDEVNYIKTFRSSVDSHIYRHTDYIFEGYRRASLLVKTQSSVSEKVFPSENMVAKLILLFAQFIYSRPFTYLMDDDGQLRVTQIELEDIFSELKKEYRQHWTKVYRTAKVEDLVRDSLNEMEKWNMVEKDKDGQYILKDSLFSVIGDYFDKE